MLNYIWCGEVYYLIGRFLDMYSLGSKFWVNYYLLKISGTVAFVKGEKKYYNVP